MDDAVHRQTARQQPTAMGVDRLALDGFRSWKHLVVDFSPRVNVLVGRNGIGKTNIVEAMEFLSVGSSHRASATRWLVERGAAHATIRANARIAQDGEDPGKQVRLQATLPARGAVRTRINDGPSRYFGDIAGLLKVVLFSPSDEQLVSGAPALRRDLLDQTCVLMDPGYYRVVQQFRQTARQRAAILRRLQEGFGSDEEQQSALAELEAWTAQFTGFGIQVTHAREKAVRALAPLVTSIYRELSGGQDEVVPVYRPSFEEVATAADLQEAQQQIARHFQRLYAGEVARGASLIGPQRDDVELLLDGEPARQTASNGEMWTIALCLRMAQYRWLAARGPQPLLVLDDVFSQLDERRRAQILDFARGCGQVFITVAARSDIPGGLAADSDDSGSAASGTSPSPDSAVRIVDVEALAEQDRTDPALEQLAAGLRGERQ